MRQIFQSAVVLCLFTAPAMSQVTSAVGSIHSQRSGDARLVLPGAELSATTEVYADLRARLSRAEAAQRGELWLLVSADAGPSQHITLRIPLASTEDAYGESRSCTAVPGGGDVLTFTAGLDEDNFVRFAPSDGYKQFHLLLNKYLCRALAAPFHCGDRNVELLSPWTSWRLGRQMSLQLSSDLPAQLEIAASTLLPTRIAFGRARCAVVAPSNGICCVAGKTTQWHCGGTPAGPGWHQVSGDCFHRETGGSCRDQP